MGQMSNRDDLQAEYGAVMREFMASAVFFQDAVARAAGLNSTDLQALGLLVSAGSLSPGELARQTGITAGGAITLLVDRLEAAGLAHRSRDEQDRRKVRITPDSAQAHARLAPLYDIASILPYGFDLQKIRSAMKIGGEYRMRDIGARQWRKLAKDLRLDADALMPCIRDFARKIPDTLADIRRAAEDAGLDHPLIERLSGMITERAQRSAQLLENNSATR